jgi:hypothetical protein
MGVDTKYTFQGFNQEDCVDPLVLVTTDKIAGKLDLQIGSSFNMTATGTEDARARSTGTALLASRNSKDSALR